MSVWAPVQYGWGVVYWLTVEGVPVVWIERETALALPTGYTQDASLVIDKSSEVGQLVDRETGLGVGLPLTFHLLDTVAVRGWLKRWPRETFLSANVAWNDAVIHVDDVTGWPAAGVFWLGSERITYTGTVGGADPRFTGCTRGTAGSLASQHYVGSVGAKVTDLPRWWRGRQVRLYASPVTPDGTITGATLAAEADEIWRGVIDQGPDRVGALWEVQAQALDRRLDLPLAGQTTGTVLDTVARYPVEPGQWFQVHVAGFNQFAAKLWEFVVSAEPFAGLASGTLLTPQAQADAIVAAWAAALPLAVDLSGGGAPPGGVLGSLLPLPPGPGGWVWQWQVELQAGAVPPWGVVGSKCAWSSEPTGVAYQEQFPLGVVAGQLAPLHWLSNGSHIATHFGPGAPAAPAYGIAVELDAPASALAAWGRLRVGDVEVTYSSVLISGQIAFFGGLYKAGQKPLDLATIKAGATVEILHTIGGTAANVARTLLSSSGTGQRGTYDTLGYGEGYGLDGSTAATSAVENASFAALASGPLVALPVEVEGSGRTFAEAFGGLLALSQRGVVLRGDDLTGTRRQRLAMVSTEPGGSAWYKTITDDDLLTTDGEPVTAVRKRDVPNVIRVLSPQGADEPDKFTVTDLPAVAQQGAVEVEYELPFAGKLSADQVTQWALGRFVPAQTEQAIEVRLVPWLDIDVGDLVHLDLTHFAVWQWSTGTPGYVGMGRVLGIKRDLRMGTVTATILIDGTTSKLALCPAAQVASWTGPAAAPTTITIEERFYSHLRQTLDLAGAPFEVLHFEAGLGGEAGGGGYSVSDVTDSGTACVLTVAAVVGGAVLTAYSWLTLPATASCTPYQASFAHVDDGSSWG